MAIWPYLQSRNRNTDVENKPMDTKGNRGCGMNWEIDIDICTLLILCIKWITNENLLYSTGNPTPCSLVTLTGRKSRKGSGGGSICICIADLLGCTVETNNIVKQLYSKKKKRGMSEGNLTYCKCSNSKNFMFYTMGVPLCWKSYSILFWFYRPMGLPLKRCFNYLRAIPFQTLLLTCSKWQNYQTVAAPLYSTSGPLISCVIDLSIPPGHSLAVVTKSQGLIRKVKQRPRQVVPEGSGGGEWVGHFRIGLEWRLDSTWLWNEYLWVSLKLE